MNVLITGISICGKSTLRRKIVAELCKFRVAFFQYDVDEFTTVRDDRDLVHVLEREKVSSVMASDSNKLVLIEDVHGPMRESFQPLSVYDLVIYVEAGFFSYFMFWLGRAKRWFKNGQFAWTKDRGWQGTQKPYDWHNIPGIARYLIRACFLRRRWVRGDLDAIYRTGAIVCRVKSRWTFIGPRFKYRF